MSLDPVTNFAKVEVDAGYDASATSITLASGDGSKLPDPATDGSFNIVWWDSTTYPDPADDPSREIVRCTARSGDVLTVSRAQEGTTASAHNSAGKTYKMVLALTKKTIDDMRTALASAFVIEEPTGDVDGVNMAFVFTAEPKAISVNGATYRQGRVWSWDSGTMTATLTFAPDTGSDVYGVM